MNESTLTISLLLVGILGSSIPMGCSGTPLRRQSVSDLKAQNTLTEAEARELAIATAEAGGCNVTDYKIQTLFEEDRWLVFFERKSPTRALGGDNSFLITVKPDRSTRLSGGL